VAVLDLKTGQRKPLIRNGGHAEYVDPSPGSGQAGYLIYAAAGTLRAVRFDPDRLEVQSDAVPIVDEVLTKALGAAEFSVSRSGALVYVPGGINDTGIHRSLVWVNRQGREEPIRAPVRAYFLPRLSPDGNRIALDVRDQDNDIWTWDLAHETLTRITKSPAFDIFPIWTHDGQHILFASARDGVTNLYWQSADGTGSAERLTTSQNPQMPLSISPDGTHVVVRDVSLKGGNGLHLLDLGGPSTSLGATKRTEPLLPATFPADNGIISPDSHWFAYESNESGQYQIYVRPFPNVNAGLRQVSSGGGRSPVWEPRGRELFYLDGNGFLTTVPVQTSTATTFNFGKPTKLLNTKYFTAAVRTYDISRDGQKFLMIKDAPVANQPTPISIVVVLNWFEELTTRVPAK
jgi:serine/threonine-protein kinase